MLEFRLGLTTTNDLVIGGGFDGWVYVLDKNTGKLLWEYNTNISFTELAGIEANGGSIESRWTCNSWQ